MSLSLSMSMLHSIMTKYTSTSTHDVKIDPFLLVHICEKIGWGGQKKKKDENRKTWNSTKNVPFIHPQPEHSECVQHYVNPTNVRGTIRSKQINNDKIITEAKTNITCVNIDFNILALGLLPYSTW